MEVDGWREGVTGMQALVVARDAHWEREKGVCPLTSRLSELACPPGRLVALLVKGMSLGHRECFTGGYFKGNISEPTSSRRTDVGIQRVA